MSALIALAALALVVGIVLWASRENRCKRCNLVIDGDRDVCLRCSLADSEETGT